MNTSTNRIIVTVYVKKECEECTKVLQILKSLEKSHPHHTVIIDIDEDPGFKGQFQDPVPYLQIGPYQLQNSIDRKRIIIALNAAKDRAKQIDNLDDSAYQKKEIKSRTYSKADNISFWLTRHYMFLINFVLFLYVGLPFLAPVFMKFNMEIPAKVIYTIYRPLCHQFAFRSWFLFGEQPVYPRALANLDYDITYENLVGHTGIDPDEARMIIGDEKLGYKVALCERDVAIWGSFLITGIGFSLSGRKIRPIPWYIWVIVGVIPIALDGGSQFIDYALPSLNNFLARESTPFLRTLTGCIFGILTGWYLYPLIAESMVESEQILVRKQKISRDPDLSGKIK